MESLRNPRAQPDFEIRRTCRSKSTGTNMVCRLITLEGRLKKVNPSYWNVQTGNCLFFCGFLPRLSCKTVSDDYSSTPVADDQELFLESLSALLDNADGAVDVIGEETCKKPCGVCFRGISKAELGVYRLLGCLMHKKTRPEI